MSNFCDKKHNWWKKTGVRNGKCKSHIIYNATITTVPKHGVELRVLFPSILPSVMEVEEGKEVERAKCEEEEEASLLSISMRDTEVRKNGSEKMEEATGKGEASSGGSGDAKEPEDCGEVPKGEEGSAGGAGAVDDGLGANRVGDASHDAEFVIGKPAEDFGPRVSPEGSDQTDSITQIANTGKC